MTWFTLEKLESKFCLILPLDSHGAYSGSAMQFGDNLFLFYTGNVRDENWIRHPYQIGALMDKDGNITKIDKILIDQPADSTDHFRDPQIFNFKGQCYAIVGGQDLRKRLRPSLQSY